MFPVPVSPRSPLLFVSGLVLTALLCTAVVAAEAPVIDHRVEAEFDIEAHSVGIIDHIVVPPGVQELRLGEQWEISMIIGPDQVKVDTRVAVRPVEDEDGPYQQLDLGAMGIGRNGGEVTLVYSAVCHESVEDVVFSRENVGGEISATISDEGIYLSAMSGWLAGGENILATHDLELDTPAGFETVTQGERLRHEEKDGRLLTRWRALDPSDGLTLVANRYFVHEEPAAEGVTGYTYFLEDDARLRATYLERTRAYLKMYQDRIGPYPYAKFATVENWFPTGYGMPSYTLLGGQVLRLPFIPYTSFGHEICHNWWGNSVFVDVDSGNWCEGLTVYCADYAYKEQESAEAARGYRRTLLKDFAAYVKEPGQDFPLTEFRSRHSGATRAVGYGKSMMVFHMIDRMIGRETFDAGMRRVAAGHQFRQASWSDFMDAFGELSGRDLTAFQQQWLTRTGAPDLHLEKVVFDADGVSFRLTQGEPVYQLDVPVVLTTAQGEREEIVQFDAVSGEYRLDAAGVRQIAVDPDCHLFRRLAPEEIEPTISRVLGDAAPTFVMDGPEPAIREAVQAFATDFMEEPLFSTIEDGALPADLPPEARHSNIVFNPGAKLLKGYSVPGLVCAGKTVVLEGKRYSLSDYDLVFAAANPYYGDVTDLVVLCSSPERLQALSRRVGHYGKYSWLLLPHGQGKVLRGNWPTSDSPLIAKK